MVSSEASSPLDEMPTSALPVLAPLIGTSSTSLGWHWWPRRALQDTQHSWQVLQLLFIYLAPGEGKFQKDCRLENSCWRAGRGKLCYCYFHPVLGNHGLPNCRLHLQNISSLHRLGFLLQIITQAFFSSQLHCHNSGLARLTATQPLCLTHQTHLPPTTFLTNHHHCVITRAK